MFPTIPEDLSALSLDELAALFAECVAAAPDLQAAATTPETVAAFAAFATSVANVRTEIASRETTEPVELSAEDQAALDAAAAVFSDTPPAAPGDGDEGGNGDDGDGDEGGNGDDGETVTLSPDQIVELVNTAVTAALPARTRPRQATVVDIATLAARVAPEHAPLSQPQPPPFTITAAADIPNVPLGSPLDASSLAVAMLERSKALGHGTGGPDDKVPVASFALARGEDRTLSPGDYAASNDRKIRDAAEERESIVAAGGLCAPVNSYYEQKVISEAWRPVFGGPVTQFTVDRGGLRFNPPASLAEVTSGVGTVTAAQDLAGGAPAAKPCFVVTCAAITEVDVEADFVCVEFGNFGARTFPENVEMWMALAAAAHARLAEGNRLTDIKTGSVATTAAGLTGAGRELLTRTEQQAQVLNSAARRPNDAPMEVILPQWALALIRADFTRTLSDDPDLIGVTDQEISAWFAARHLMVTLTPDSATGNGQVIAAEAGGVINEYPTAVVADIFVPGTFIGLDNGRLDLGLVRDSALTMGSAVAPTTPGNRFRMFYESFEALAKVGPAGSAAELTMSLCADGTYGAAKAVTCPIVT